MNNLGTNLFVYILAPDMSGRGEPAGLLPIGGWVLGEKPAGLRSGLEFDIINYRTVHAGQSNLFGRKVLLSGDELQSRDGVNGC
jgi:hypothetical protein